MRRLVVVSNRLPHEPAESPIRSERAAPVGGLVSAILPVLEREGGLWFGWSGRSTERHPNAAAAIARMGLAQVALSEEDVNLYYTGFANRTLWPILHGFLLRAIIRRDTYGAYRRVNRRFAEALAPMLQPDDLVWVHDFHLFHVGQELRRLGWKGKTGFFLHSPFPPAEVFTVLPWARQILEGLMYYDLAGFHTQRYVNNALDAIQLETGASVSAGKATYEGRTVRFGAYPVGIDPKAFSSPQPGGDGAASPRPGATTGQRLLLGVDRLDYTKGIPERLHAFERLLEHRPSVRGKVSFLQISAPSRTRVPDYIREKERVDQLVGQINGRFSEPDWLPVRYLYRSYEGLELVPFYRDADVCVVTPLRDGMNLVAKEFVASQDDDPGVLLLSRFCGAAESMGEAVVVNPYDIEGTAEAMYRALSMPRTERLRRWQALMDSVSSNTAQSWFESFRDDLVAV